MVFAEEHEERVCAQMAEVADLKGACSGVAEYVVYIFVSV